jgi:hypothetical protein
MIPITLYIPNYFGGQAGQVDNQKKLNCITLFILHSIKHRYIPHKYDALSTTFRKAITVNTIFKAQNKAQFYQKQKIRPPD